jgi:hypothetical protein
LRFAPVSWLGELARGGLPTAFDRSGRSPGFAYSCAAARDSHPLPSLPSRREDARTWLSENSPGVPERRIYRHRKSVSNGIRETTLPLDNVATAPHLNLRSQVKFGLAPWEALQSATLLTARAYHKEKDLGSLPPASAAPNIAAAVPKPRSHSCK